MLEATIKVKGRTFEILEEALEEVIVLLGHGYFKHTESKGDPTSVTHLYKFEVTGNECDNLYMEKEEVEIRFTDRENVIIKRALQRRWGEIVIRVKNRYFTAYRDQKTKKTWINGGSGSWYKSRT